MCPRATSGSISQRRNCTLAVGAGRGVVAQLPADGTEGRQLQLGGALVLVVVAGRGRRGRVVTAAAAAAAAV